MKLKVTNEQKIQEGSPVIFIENCIFTKSFSKWNQIQNANANITCSIFLCRKVDFKARNCLFIISEDLSIATYGKTIMEPIEVHMKFIFFMLSQVYSVSSIRCGFRGGADAPPKPPPPPPPPSAIRPLPTQRVPPLILF